MNLLPFLWLSLLLAAVPSHAAPPALAPGYGPLPFPAPQAGTYQLPKLGEAADGKVLDSDGKAMHLHDLYGDKLVLLGFIYATCDDVNGCPLATTVFRKIKTQLKASPPLADRLRLITLSFNPEHDTPQAMAHYGQGFQDAGVEWRFLTTAAEAEIQPILKAYGQSVEKELDDQGRATGKYSHLLRVFLIDRNRMIRNIYTVSVLHPETVMADVATLLKETDGPSARVVTAAASGRALLGAGDDKAGYAAAEYQTRSVALAQRTGQSADLYALSRQPGLGLPAIPTSGDNPLTREKIALGRKLFYDRRLSLNQTFSCAMCHIPEQGFTSQEQATAIGIEGRTVRRNAPTILNVAYLTRLFHDGRESSLENQVWGPFLAANEMGNPSVGAVLDKLKALPDYRGLFERAFRRGPTMDTVGQALASYERALVAADAPFDRWRYGKQDDALSPAARAGYALFTGKAGCAQCHVIGPKTALLTDNQLHNTGVGYQESMRREPDKTRVQVAPGIAFDVDAARIGAVAEARPNDLGRYEVTQNPADRWQYRTPTLRNVALTAPYMHNGRLATLREVVEFYNRGGVANENLDPLIQPLNLTADERDALVAFLEALTGSQVATLVADAWSAPVGER